MDKTEGTQFHHGTVKWFDRVKRFGVIEMDNGGTILFKFKHGRWPAIVDGKAAYAGSTIPYLGGRSLPMPDPERGDPVFFEIANGDQNRPLAIPWTFEYELIEAWMKYEDDESKCPHCPHKMGEHPKGICTHGCDCGYTDYWEDEYSVTITLPPYF